MFDQCAIRGLLASLVRRAHAEGGIAPGIDADAVAWAILALAHGLAAQLLYQPQPDPFPPCRVVRAVAVADAVVLLLVLVVLSSTSRTTGQRSPFITQPPRPTVSRRSFSRCLTPA